MVEEGPPGGTSVEHTRLHWQVASGRCILQQGLCDTPRAQSRIDHFGFEESAHTLPDVEMKQATACQASDYIIAEVCLF